MLSGTDAARKSSATSARHICKRGLRSRPCFFIWWIPGIMFWLPLGSVWFIIWWMRKAPCYSSLLCIGTLTKDTNLMNKFAAFPSYLILFKAVTSIHIDCLDISLNSSRLHPRSSLIASVITPGGSADFFCGGNYFFNDRGNSLCNIISLVHLISCGTQDIVVDLERTKETRRYVYIS